MSLDSPELGCLAWVLAPVDWLCRNRWLVLTFLAGVAVGYFCFCHVH
jgi:hypothetical protein